MKKFVAILLCFVTVLSLAACGTGQNEANPWVDYDSLEEINEQVGCNLRGPCAMCAINERFSVGDMGEYKMAQYQFTMCGFDYTFRCAPTTEDISGVYNHTGKTAFAESSDEELQLVTVDGIRLARWLTIDGQYVLMVEDHGEMNDKSFQNIAQEMMELTCTDMANANG